MQTSLPPEWRRGRLGDLFARVTRKNAAGCERVLTASGEHGLIDQQEYFNKSVAGRDLSSYYHLMKGEFAYNRSSMNGYPVGAIKRLDKYDEGILSTLYICFAQRSGVPLVSDYAAQLFESGVLDDEIASITQVGARAHGLLNVKVSDFMEVSLPLPPLPEQKKIAAILSSVDESIQATSAVLAQTRTVKQGLLQELLTRGIGRDGRPHTRFKQTEIGEIPEGWEVVKLADLASIERGKFSHRPRNAPHLYGGAYPFVQTGDIGHADDLLTQHTQTLNDEGLAYSRMFPVGTILITIAANIGDVALTTYEIACPDSLVGIIPHKCDPLWLLYVLAARKRRLELGASESAQKNINLQTLRPLRIAVPPVAEQREIRARIEAVSELASTNAEHLERLQQVKAGLLQDLLTGKVRVTP